ncbi:MAG: metal-dependent hydrolase [Alphaproteobacteria bacterium]|nr:metal-dependent hydrolase [Alphaproteobacteria bacterium]
MKITALGHSAFRIEFGNSVILVDPFITGNPAARTDWKTASEGCTHVLLTHGHSDHIGDAVDILKVTGAVLVSNFEICNYLAAKGVENYSPGNHGGTISFDEFSVTFTNAWHSSSEIVAGTPVYLGNPAGFIIRPKAAHAKTLYIAGDTGLSLDMQLIDTFYHPHIGILPIGDRFTMGAEQAAYAARNLFSFEIVIPCHYASFKGFVADDASEFLAAMGPEVNKVKVLAAGESLTV